MYDKIRTPLTFKFKTFKIKNAIKVKKNLKRNVCGIHVYKIILKGMYMKYTLIFFLLLLLLLFIFFFCTLHLPYHDIKLLYVDE